MSASGIISKVHVQDVFNTRKQTSSYVDNAKHDDKPKHEELPKTTYTSRPLIIHQGKESVTSPKKETDDFEKIVEVIKRAETPAVPVEADEEDEDKTVIHNGVTPVPVEKSQAENSKATAPDPAPIENSQTEQIEPADVPPAETAKEAASEDIEKNIGEKAEPVTNAAEEKKEDKPIEAAKEPVGDKKEK